MTNQAATHVSLSDITAVVKTFQRPRSLDRLIRSLRRFYPDLHIMVADDSLTPRPRRDVEYVRLEPDTGVGAGRNALLQRVATPYFLTLDDDYELTGETRIESLVELVAGGQAAIAAGDCLRCKRRLFRTKYRPQPYFGTIEIADGQLTLSQGFRSRHEGYLLCDIVPQFFVADTRAIQSIGGWDSELKTNDHQEFFVRAKRHGLMVAYRASVSVLHWHTMPKDYATYRKRDHRAIAARKMGITKWVEMDGRTFTFNRDPEHFEVGPWSVSISPESIDTQRTARTNNAA
ncbi:MAG: glycosyltransferase family 2 protein [Pirellulaceae bacterium]